MLLKGSVECGCLLSDEKWQPDNKIPWSYKPKIKYYSYNVID